MHEVKRNDGRVRTCALLGCLWCRMGHSSSEALARYRTEGRWAAYLREDAPLSVGRAGLALHLPWRVPVLVLWRLSASCGCPTAPWLYTSWGRGPLRALLSSNRACHLALWEPASPRQVSLRRKHSSYSLHLRSQGRWLRELLAFFPRRKGRE